MENLKYIKAGHLEVKTEEAANMFMIQQQNAPQSHNIKIADKCFEK
jgi:hypothetical protein